MSTSYAVLKRPCHHLVVPDFGQRIPLEKLPLSNMEKGMEPTITSQASRYCELTDLLLNYQIMRPPSSCELASADNL